LDCGTGAGGFKPGNDCARGGASGKKKDEPKVEKDKFIPSMHGSDGAIRKFEERVKNQNFESALIVDGNGEVIVQKNGDKDSVTFSEDEMRNILEAQKTTLTHNHPSNSAFSKEDMKFAANTGLFEIRAVTKDHVYVLRREPGAEKWPAEYLLGDEYEKQKWAVFEKYNPISDRVSDNPARSNQEFMNEVCENVAARFNLYYARF
jgi:hypothetical protein